MKTQMEYKDKLLNRAFEGIEKFIMFLFLFLFFTTLSAQIYSKGDAKIDVKEGTILYVSDSIQLKSESTANRKTVIFVVEGTVIHNLEESNHIEMVVVKPKKNTEESHTAKAEPPKRKLKPTPAELQPNDEAKRHKPKFTSSSGNYSFLFYRVQTAAITAPANSLGMKILCSEQSCFYNIISEYRCVNSITDCHEVVLTSIYYHSHPTRPPPFYFS